mmetsp:Transcript_8504/g.20515  ORF Transcript_8504/g.20515 Transcript_8504/m.20515 type:complete len:201 (+) Transcript_8504:396-998(+)
MKRRSCTLPLRLPRTSFPTCVPIGAGPPCPRASAIGCPKVLAFCGRSNPGGSTPRRQRRGHKTRGPSAFPPCSSREDRRARLRTQGEGRHVPRRLTTRTRRQTQKLRVDHRWSRSWRQPLFERCICKEVCLSLSISIILQRGICGWNCGASDFSFYYASCTPTRPVRVGSRASVINVLVFLELGICASILSPSSTYFSSR